MVYDLGGQKYTCHECGASYTERWQTRRGEPLGADSLEVHLRQTGHDQWAGLPDRRELVDNSVDGQTRGRLTAKYRSGPAGTVIARCGCGRDSHVPAGQWGTILHCGAEYEILEPDTAMHAVVDDAGQVTCLVTSVPRDTTSDEVAELLARCGVSARLGRSPLSRCRVAELDSLPATTPGLSEAQSKLPSRRKRAPGWISDTRISWTGMLRHSHCMTSGYRADDPRYIWTGIRYGAMKGKRLSQFLSAYPRCELCGAASTDVDHDHISGLVRGALCNLCNVYLGRLDKVCEPGYPLGPGPESRETLVDAERFRNLYARMPHWFSRALSYTHHDESVVLGAYDIKGEG